MSSRAPDCFCHSIKDAMPTNRSSCIAALLLTIACASGERAAEQATERSPKPPVEEQGVHSREAALALNAARWFSRKIEQGDFKGAIKYVLPSMVQGMGGEEAAVRAFSEIFASDDPERRMHNLRLEPDQPVGVARYGNDLLAVVPVSMSFQSFQGSSETLVSVSYWLLGLSADEGVSWVFVDGDDEVFDVLVGMAPAACRWNIPRKTMRVGNPGEPDYWEFTDETGDFTPTPETVHKILDKLGG